MPLGVCPLGLSAMAGSGLDEFEKIQVLGMIALYVRNEAKLEYDMKRAYEAALASAEGDSLQVGPSAYGQTGPATYGDILRRLVDPAKFPALTAVIESGAFDDSHNYTDEDFEFGLQRILDGIAAHLAAKSRADHEP